jgi:hypothetical protein
MQFTDEVAWNLAEFAVAGVLLVGAGLTQERVASKAGNTQVRYPSAIFRRSGRLDRRAATRQETRLWESQP